MAVSRDAGDPPNLGALRPDPVGKAGSLPPVKMAGSTASFQVGTPMHAVLEFGSEGYELTSFSSGLMIFAEFVDTDIPDPSVRYYNYVIIQTPPCEQPAIAVRYRPQPWSVRNHMQVPQLALSQVPSY